MRSRDVIFSLTASMFSATDGPCDQVFRMFVRVGIVARLSAVHVPNLSSNIYFAIPTSWLSLLPVSVRCAW